MLSDICIEKPIINDLYCFDLLLSLVKTFDMIAVNGIYENGIVRLERKIQAKKTMKVIVTFLEEEVGLESKRLTTKDFSFIRAREISKSFTGSLSDAVIEDRKAEQ